MPSNGENLTHSGRMVQSLHQDMEFFWDRMVSEVGHCRYPGEIVPGALYLGAWQHAEDTERLDEINVKR